MPRTNTELIQELVQKVPALESELKAELKQLNTELQEQSTEADRYREHLTEELQELATQVSVLLERDVARTRELNDLNTLMQKERDERVRLQIENATLRQQLQDHIAQYQEWDRRRWGLIVMLIGAVLSLASGLIVTLARK